MASACLGASAVGTAVGAVVGAVVGSAVTVTVSTGICCVSVTVVVAADCSICEKLPYRPVIIARPTRIRNTPHTRLTAR